LYPFIKKRNLIIHSPTGTGRSSAIFIGLLNNYVPSDINQVLVLSPCRELAYQNVAIIQKFASYMDIEVKLLIGGRSIREDITSIKLGAHVLCGTPGRVFDLINRQVISIKYIKMLVIDEADDILNRGYKEIIYELLTRLSPDTQIVCATATMPQELIEMKEKLISNPIEITPLAMNLQ